MERSQRDGFEDQHIESSGKQVGGFVHQEILPEQLGESYSRSPSLSRRNLCYFRASMALPSATVSSGWGITTSPSLTPDKISTASPLRWPISTTRRRAVEFSATNTHHSSPFRNR